MIFGASGILGSAFLSKFSSSNYNRHRIFAFDHSKADITNPAHIGPLMEYVRPSVVINCAALNDEDLCQDAKTGAFLVNARGPRFLAEACHSYGAKLVHFSSPTVFDGEKATPYSENDCTRPVNIHGQSKISGEAAIAEVLNDHLIIRPGWIFHYEGANCVDTWVARAERQEDVAVLENHYGSPSFAPDIVEGVIELISRDARGVFHVANMDAASEESFCEAVLSLAHLRSNILTVSQKSQKWLKAPTPKYTVLSTKRYSVVTGKPMRPWIDALKHCLFSMNHYRP
jgi:dTDP-4-dehydrorhamnose reductase